MQDNVDTNMDRKPIDLNVQVHRVSIHSANDNDYMLSQNQRSRGESFYDQNNRKVKLTNLDKKIRNKALKMGDYL